MVLNLPCSNSSRDSLSPALWANVLDGPGNAGVYMSIVRSIGVIVSIFALIGVPWNFVVIAVILKKRIFKQPAVLLFLNLAIADLLLCVLVMPFNAIFALSGEFSFGETDHVRCLVCQSGIVLTTLLLVSVYTVALLSLDRFLYVKKPLTYGKIVTTRRVAVVLAACWMIFVAFSLLPVFGIGEIAPSGLISICALILSVGPNSNYIYLWVVIGGSCVLPVVLILVTNVWMLCIMVRSISRGYQRELENIAGSRRPSLFVTIRDRYQSSRVHLLEVFGAVIVVNVVTWLPTVVTVGLVSSGVIVFEFVAFGHLCLLSQAVLHPIIQVFLLRDIRVALAGVCLC